MECQECHIRPATLHFTKIINGQKTEMHLCEKCAREKGESFAGNDGFSINHLLSGLLHFEEPMHANANQSAPVQEEPVCDRCGLTFSEFTRVGRFGCADCYDAFREQLNPILRRVHSGNTEHAGKIPKRAGSSLHLKRELDLLKGMLQEYVRKEEFEKAAEARDKIRSIEKQMAQMREGEG